MTSLQVTEVAQEWISEWQMHRRGRVERGRKEGMTKARDKIEIQRTIFNERSANSCVSDPRLHGTGPSPSERPAPAQARTVGVHRASQRVARERNSYTLSVSVSPFLCLCRLISTFTLFSDDCGGGGYVQRDSATTTFNQADGRHRCLSKNSKRQGLALRAHRPLASDQ